MGFNTSKSYSATALHVVLNGVPITGFGPDDLVSIEFDGEIASAQQGADGEVTISRHPIPFAKGKITLQEASTSNAVIEALLFGQRLVESRSVLPFLMLDPSTGESVASAELAFSKLPTIGKGKTSGTREWEFILPYPVFTAATL